LDGFGRVSSPGKVFLSFAIVTAHSSKNFQRYFSIPEKQDHFSISPPSPVRANLAATTTFREQEQPTRQASARWASRIEFSRNADQNTTTSGSVAVIASANSLNFFAPPIS